jgi:hypothetical protein
LGPTKTKKGQQVEMEDRLKLTRKRNKKRKSKKEEKEEEQVSECL